LGQRTRPDQCLRADLVARDKVNLDIFWLKDDALDDPDLLPPAGGSRGGDRGESGDGAGTVSASGGSAGAGVKRATLLGGAIK
jgi:hypothetical protein